MPTDLTPEEEAAASDLWVSVLWLLFREEEYGEEITRGLPLSLHPSPEEARAEAGRRKDAPAPSAGPDGFYDVEPRCNLLALRQIGIADAAGVREFLARRSRVELVPQVWDAPGNHARQLASRPLSAEESRRATALTVWTVYYEDRFHTGPARDSFPVAVCFTREEAEAEVRRRGPVRSGADGYLAQGPHPLLGPGGSPPDVGSEVVREVLRRIALGQPGPVEVRS